MMARVTSSGNSWKTNVVIDVFEHLILGKLREVSPAKGGRSEKSGRFAKQKGWSSYTISRARKERGLFVGNQFLHREMRKSSLSRQVNLFLRHHRIISAFGFALAVDREVRHALQIAMMRVR